MKFLETAAQDVFARFFPKERTRMPSILRHLRRFAYRFSAGCAKCFYFCGREIPLTPRGMALPEERRAVMMDIMEDQTIPRRQTFGQDWDTAAYAANGRFVAALAQSVVTLLAPRAGERVVDIGCGDGALTAQLAAVGAVVMGIDASLAMVTAARARAKESAHPFAVEHVDAESLAFEGQFDAAFSNAALHWIPAERQPGALCAVYRGLRPGGRFVAEMGGQGNIAAIRTALQATLAMYGIDAEEVAASFYPSPSEYRQLLEDAGFAVQQIDLYPRPTPLPGGAEGMTRWLETFRHGVLDRFAPEARAASMKQTVDLLRPILCDGKGNWTADYVRLRFHAIRPRD